MSDLLGAECLCLKSMARNSLVWSLDFRIVEVAKDLRLRKDLLEEARKEFKEVVGREPGQYGSGQQIDRLQKELDYYVQLRDEITEIKACS